MQRILQEEVADLLRHVELARQVKGLRPWLGSQNVPDRVAERTVRKLPLHV
jgi:hypothetical protein